MLNFDQDIKLDRVKGSRLRYKIYSFVAYGS